MKIDFILKIFNGHKIIVIYMQVKKHLIILIKKSIYFQDMILIIFLYNKIKIITIISILNLEYALNNLLCGITKNLLLVLIKIKNL